MHFEDLLFTNPQALLSPIISISHKIDGSPSIMKNDKGEVVSKSGNKLKLEGKSKEYLEIIEACKTYLPSNCWVEVLFIPSMLKYNNSFRSNLLTYYDPQEDLSKYDLGIVFHKGYTTNISKKVKVYRSEINNISIPLATNIDQILKNVEHTLTISSRDYYDISKLINSYIRSEKEFDCKVPNLEVYLELIKEKERIMKSLPKFELKSFFPSGEEAEFGEGFVVHSKNQHIYKLVDRRTFSYNNFLTHGET